MDGRQEQQQKEELMIPVPLSLIQRMCSAFLEMVDQGARTTDQSLMVDLEHVVADYDRKHL